MKGRHICFEPVREIVMENAPGHNCRPGRWLRLGEPGPSLWLVVQDYVLLPDYAKQKGSLLCSTLLNSSYAGYIYPILVCPERAGCDPEWGFLTSGNDRVQKLTSLQCRQRY